MGQPNLTDEQFEVLAQYYKDPKIPGNVMWTRFLTDTEMGEWHYAGRFSGSLYVSGKLPSYPSPKPTFCPMWEISVNVSLGEG